MLCGSRIALLSLLTLGGCGRIGYTEPLERDAGDVPPGDAFAPPDARFDASADAPLVDAPTFPDAFLAADAGNARDEFCGRATTLTCLDFESDMVSPWARFTSTSGTPATYEPRADFRGRAMHTHGDPSQYTGVRFSIPDPATIRAGLYVRYFLRLTRAATTGFLVLGEFNGMRFGSFSKVSVDSDSTGRFQISAIGGGGPPLGAFPENRWVCVQLDLSSSTARAEVDGVMTTITPPLDVGNLEWVAIGINTQRDIVDAYFDDVVISTVPVPCLPM